VSVMSGQLVARIGRGVPSSDTERAVSFIRLSGVAPTGRTFDVDHVHAFRLAAGMVVEHWAVRDDLTMHAQLGVNASA
jgi:hypothetical protein